MTSRSPHPAPALLALSMLAACGPNDVALGAFQYGSNLGGMALDSLHDANDEEETIDPEAVRAKSRQLCIEHALSEADCAGLMAQTEKSIELLYRLQGLDLAAEEMRRKQLQEALNPVNAVGGIARGAAGHAGARGLAGDRRQPVSPGHRLNQQIGQPERKPAAVFSTCSRIRDSVAGRRRMPCVARPMSRSSSASRSPRTGPCAESRSSRWSLARIVCVSCQL